jgi:hypothetical protein
MVRSNVRYLTPREDWAQLIAAPRTAPKDVAAVGDDVACKFSLRPIIDGRTGAATEAARSYKHSSTPSAWIGQQVQTQATFLAYIDAFWELTVLSFAALPLALFLRNVKLGEPTPVTHRNR